MRAARPGLFPHIDIPPNDSSGVVHVIAVKARAVGFVFPNHGEPAGRCAMTFPPTGDAGGGGLVFPAEKIGLLRAEIYDYPRTTGTSLRNVGKDEVTDSTATTECK